MIIGVLSDSHDQIDKIKEAVEIFNREQVGLVIHCGDWVAPFTLQYFANLLAPMKGVFGNNDGDRFLHPVAARNFQVNVEYEERVLSLVIEDRKIFVYHGDYGEVTEALLLCGKYDAVFHGHTHRKVNELVGDTLSLNPGTLMPVTAPTITGASIALYDTATNTARHIEL